MSGNPGNNRVLIAGCGDIGLRVARLLNKRYRLFGLVRNTTRCKVLRQAGITPVAGDLDNTHSLRRLAGMAHIVLHFAPPSGNGSSDTRTRNLLAALSRGTRPRRLVYISTTGVYGDCGGALVEETCPLHPQTSRSILRAEAEQQIRSWARRNRVNASILRVPGIYAADRLPLDRLRAGTPAILHEEDSYTGLIHADDLTRAVVAALHHAKPNRVYHTSDDSNMKMGEYFDCVADAFELPRPLRLARTEVQRMVSPMLWSFLNESRQMTNRRMKQELGVQLRYPTVKNALKG